MPASMKKRAMTTWDYLVEDGRQKEREKAVRNMILGGFETELICKILEVTPDYVARIRKEVESSK